MLREILLLCLAGGVCALDTATAWQLMLSQPLVSGTAAGLLVGAPHAGIFIGLVLQLLWSAAIPMGARPMPDAPVGSVSGVWFAVTLLETNCLASSSFCYLLGLIAALAVALLGRRTILLEREIGRRLFKRFVKNVNDGRDARPEKAVSLAVAIGFARGFLLCLLAMGALTPLALLLAENPGLSARDYSLTLLVLEALGVGVLFSVFVGRSRARLLTFGGGAAWAFLIMSVFRR
ncbi:MAG: PTS sugar transporter subunit IIC [Candidatus Eisenbacteria bacterium]|nr:PTS sugar transporter subunit IIC [Candidatus Eisenbacteria bacterium]